MFANRDIASLYFEIQDLKNQFLETERKLNKKVGFEELVCNCS